jgi:hypothetical protein
MYVCMYVSDGSCFVWERSPGSITMLWMSTYLHTWSCLQTSKEKLKIAMTLQDGYVNGFVISQGGGETSDADAQ